MSDLLARNPRTPPRDVAHRNGTFDRASRRFGLNDSQVRLIAEAFPKRDYYLQSRAGNRLFELGLGPIALAFAAASSPEDQLLIETVLAKFDANEFAQRYLAARELQWAANLISTFEHLRDASS